MAYNVKFLKGTAQQYKDLALKDANAFYFTSDDSKLYLGTIELSNPSDLATVMAQVATNTGDITAIKTELQKLTGDGDESISKMIETAIEAVEEKIGELTSLDTDDKTDLVSAINEVKGLADNKVASVAATDKSIEVSGTATAPTVGVKISNKAGNNLTLETTEGSEGLYVNVPQETDYTVTVEKSSETIAGVAARYTIGQVASGLSTIIDIPKDLMIKSGSVKTEEGVTYIVLVLNDEEETEIKVDVSKLIEYVTAGDDTATIHVNIDNDHKVTANVIAGSITTTELHADVVTSLNKADSALQSSDILTGSANGTISVKGSDVAVKGLDSAAYAKTTDFDAAGSASTAEQNAKDYTDTALTWGTIA